MIKGMHGMFRSDQAPQLRAFMRDKLKLPATDVGGGWLIFDIREADVGVHPTHEGDGHRSGEHDISFYTDDVKGTVAELMGRGVVFDEPIVDQGYGFVTYFTMPGDVQVQLYEPKYKKKAAAKPKASKRKVTKKQAKKKPAGKTARRKPGSAKKRPAKRGRR